MNRTSHAPNEKGAVGVNLLTVDQLLQLRNDLVCCVRRVTVIASRLESGAL